MGTSHSRSVASVREVLRPVRHPLLILLLTAVLVLGFASAAFANGNLSTHIANRLASMPPGSTVASIPNLYVVGDTSITNLEELRGATSMMYLTIANCAVDDLSALEGLENIIILDLTSNNIDDLTPLAGMGSLQRLELEYQGYTRPEFTNRLTSVAPLASCPNLTHLYLTWNDLTDVGALTALHQLQVLDISRNYLDLLEGSQDMVSIPMIQSGNPWSYGGVFTYSPQRTPPSPHAVDMVLPGSMISIHFDSVTSEGLTTTGLPELNPPPPNFRLLTSFNLNSTAVFTGYAYVTIPYDDTGLTLEQEQALTLQHWNGVGWDNITVPPVDTLNNTITGRTTSFSDFAVFVTDEEPPEPPAVSTPASSAWTLVLLAALGLGAGTLAMRRSRVQ